jgi:hypothetical protein
MQIDNVIDTEAKEGDAVGLKCRQGKKGESVYKVQPVPSIIIYKMQTKKLIAFRF